MISRRDKLQFTARMVIHHTFVLHFASQLWKETACVELCFPWTVSQGTYCISIYLHSSCSSHFDSLVFFICVDMG